MKGEQLKHFMETIDKIVSGEEIKKDEYLQYEEHDRELLFVAKMLATGVSISPGDELTEDELDMVAGGVKTNDVSCQEQKNKT